MHTAPSKQYPALSNFGKAVCKADRFMNSSSNHPYISSIKYFQILNILCKVDRKQYIDELNYRDNIQEHKLSTLSRIHNDRMAICKESSKKDNDQLHFHKFHKDCCIECKQHLIRRIQENIICKYHPNNNSIGKMYMQKRQCINYIHQDKLHMSFLLSNNYQRKIHIEFQKYMFYIYYYILYKLDYQANIQHHTQYNQSQHCTQYTEQHMVSIHFLKGISLDDNQNNLYRCQSTNYNLLSNYSIFQMSNIECSYRVRTLHLIVHNCHCKRCIQCQNHINYNEVSNLHKLYYLNNSLFDNPNNQWERFHIMYKSNRIFHNQNQEDNIHFGRISNCKFHHIINTLHQLIQYFIITTTNIIYQQITSLALTTSINIAFAINTIGYASYKVLILITLTLTFCQSVALNAFYTIYVFNVALSTFVI
ncbi:unnamed protein product [Paramecium octaurelia]|uniref:Transmembrane protein n=1 Tax=Paramecium octaurelia TaxID=43137 RepID=A0A8S1WU34_PAROT|nr:unnamed protein product [Paramecium octaurelia]